MTNAYNKVYLERARAVLGAMLEYSVYDMNLELSDFFGQFVSSGLAKRFGRGDFQLIAGKSGVELARLGVSVLSVVYFSVFLRDCRQCTY